MPEVIRAVYEKGRLRPLDPLSLTDGQEIYLAILSAREQVEQALAGILAPILTEPSEALDEAAIMAMIDTELRGGVSVSSAIIEERREGP
jgi:predicted DNA-binding antitoxin AbrB/MazE fold protein